MRISSLESLFNELIAGFEHNQVDYAVCGNYHKLPAYTDNDVDIWVSDMKLSEAILMRVARNSNLRLYMQNKTANGINNYFYDPSSECVDIVKIDLMRETAYKSVVCLVPASMIRENRERYKNFDVVSSDLESVMHLLYPLVSLGTVKDKYKLKFKDKLQSDKFKYLLKGCVGSDLSLKLCGCIENDDWEGVVKLKNKVLKYILFNTILKPSPERASIFWKFVISLATRIINKNGIMIAFTGIDGAGKTSIKDYLISNADRYFCKNRNREFYWRPFLLPKISKALGVSSQNEVLDKSGRRMVSRRFIPSVKSFIKYFYYLTDFIIGQAKYFKITHTGGIAAFDRYHFDNIVYPERFGFSLNKNFMRLCDRWVIPKPDILFYFTADATTLYERKKEIDIPEIKLQQNQYEDELKYLNYCQVVYTDGDIESTKRTILMMCLSKMAESYEIVD